jgi:PadR family transcriptional regulator PadR
MINPALKKGSAELLILSLLRGGRQHGYELAKLIEIRSGGRIQFMVSSLYPVLYRMEQRGWIRGRWVERQGQRRRRYYRLTDSGKQALDRQRSAWKELTLAVNLIVEPSHA